MARLFSRKVAGVVAALVGVCTALFVAAGPAAAATGVQGGIRYMNVYCDATKSPGGDCRGNGHSYMAVTVRAWAVNLKVAPVQGIQLKFYDADATLVHTTAEYEANLNDPTDWAHVKKGPKTIGWYYAPGYHYATGSAAWVGKATQVCVAAHNYHSAKDPYRTLACRGMNPINVHV